MIRKARIAHLAGPNATIQNTPPLVTSNKARAKNKLPLLTNPDGTPAHFDVLRPQRLAAPVTVYVEQFTAHPLEADTAELYGPPDGYVDSVGRMHKERQSASDKPVYEVELRPEDGLYPLPYMATQADGSAWEENARSPTLPKRRRGKASSPTARAASRRSTGCRSARRAWEI
jgi:L-asparaginase